MKKFFLTLFIAISAGASFAQHFEVVPSAITDNGYIIEKVWLQRYEKPDVQIKNTTFKTIEKINKEVITAPPATLDVVMGMERKRPFAFVRIPVFSFADAHFQQLKSFDLEITEPNTSGPSVQAHAKTTALSSVLATGKWYKIALTERGIYKIDYDFIKNKIGIDPATINTAHIRVYGNGGVMLSENNAVARPDDLTENPITVYDGGDGMFNTSDYFIFYANGTMGWDKDSTHKSFVHRKNLYSDSSYYFINFDLGPGLSVQTQQGSLTGNTVVSDFNDYAVHESDEVNIGKFGKQWWGDEFSYTGQTTRVFNFNMGTLVDSVQLRAMFGSRSFSNGNVFSVKLNNNLLNSYTFAAVGVSEEDSPILTESISFKKPASGSTISVEISYSPGDNTAKGYLNYVEVQGRRALSFPGGQLSFRDWNSVGAGKVATYHLQNANGNMVVWDVTNPLQPVAMNGGLSGGVYSFTQDASRLHEFIGFDGSQYLVPAFVKKIDNQNLHGHDQVDLIVVTYPDFKEAADKLAAFHQEHDGMRTIVATTEQIYNEFSSGGQDLSAIRDFARMFYQRAGNDTTQMPRYLTIVGDASYDYKNRIRNNTNYVPTYETAESEAVILGYCSDDFFGFLDDNENIEDVSVANTMDMSVGRLPVSTLDEANGVVGKIINYKTPASLGPWRVSTTIISDNGDGELHFDDGEIMAGTINSHSNLYNESKVYLSAISTISTPAGDRAPDANKMINDQIYKGTFLMNYNGHGSIYTLAHERILTQDDFNAWKNMNMLPIMVTATCEFSRYDDPEALSAGEKLILKSDGGAIALLTTTQLVYQYLNRPMNIEFLNAQFQKYGGKWPTIGDAFRYSKNVTYSTPQTAWELANYRKFALLGDPALSPDFPQHNIETEEVLDGVTMQPADTLKALGKYIIKGSIKNTSNQLVSDFNGRAYVTIYDKPKKVSTLTGSRTFKTQNNIVYKGKVTVTDGLFSLTFIAPKDLNYDFGKGKISYYAENGITDAAGADTNAVIGGYSDHPVVEDDGPIVKPFMNDSLFRDGGITGTNTLLYVQLYDETGINVSGNSVGHDLTAVLDEDVQHPYNLNDYYETAPNDYQKGYVYFPVTGLADGEHTFRVKAWDVNNNSGQGTVRFIVINGQVVKIENLMNYPNPFSDVTHFIFDHNHPEETMEARILIYSTSGYLVRTLSQTFTPGGSRSNELTWDGTSDTGAKLPAGLYVYKLNLSTEKGVHTTAYQKLILMR